MKNKKGFLLTEETLKIVIAVIGLTILIYFLVVWIQGLIVLPVLKLAPSPWKWKKSDIFFDAFHHLVLAIITVVAYVYLSSFFILIT